MAERCDWYDDIFDIQYSPSSVGVGDAVWIEALEELSQFPNGEVLSVDKDRELVIVGIYGRFNSDPHFTGMRELDLSDFEQWGECKDGKSGRRWKIHTYLT